MGLTQLASLLRQRGLATASQGSDSALIVHNPVSRPLREEITCRTGRYLTGFGYEIGQVGDKDQAADRLAFLLCAPAGGAR